MRNMGERGLLGQFAAALVGRPKAWEHRCERAPVQKREHAEAQREAMLRALRVYAPNVPVVFDVDFGHTDPQLIIPYGGEARVDGVAGAISVRY